MIKVIKQTDIPPKRGPGPVAKEFKPVLDELQKMLRKGIAPYEAVKIDVPVPKGIKQATAMIKFAMKVKELIRDEDVPYQTFFRTDKERQKNLYIVAIGNADLKLEKVK